MSRKDKSITYYICCTPNLSNMLILSVLQLISSCSSYLLWFEYKTYNQALYQRVFIAATSYLIGCLLGGMMLSRMAASTIKSSKGKVRNLKCVFISMYFVSLFASLLLIPHTKHDRLKNFIVFVVQLGISSSFVAINVAVLVLIKINHRLKFLAFTGVI